MFWKVILGGVLFFICSCQHELNTTYTQVRIEHQDSTENEVRKYPRSVILVVIDGPRWDHTFGDSSYTYIPNLARLKNEGTLYWNCYNLGETRTNPGHVALSTGIYEHIDNQGKTIPSGRSFIHDFIEREKDSSRAWIITSKDKLEILSLSKDTSVHMLPITDCGVSGNGSGYRHDSVTLRRVIEVMSEHQPDVIFANFREPDYSAHFSDFTGYYSGLKRSDEYIAALWSFVQSSEYYKDNTTLIITNDHGRHLDSIKGGLNNHGDDCDGCRRISCLILGVGQEHGKIIKDQIDLLKINQMIRELLNLK